MSASDLIDKEENTPIESCILWVLDDAYAEGYGSRIVNNQAHFLADKAAAELAALTARLAQAERELSNLVEWLKDNQHNISGEFDMDELLKPARTALKAAQP